MSFTHLINPPSPPDIEGRLVLLSGVLDATEISLQKKRQRQRRYYANNREAVRAREAAHRALHREEINAKKRAEWKAAGGRAGMRKGIKVTFASENGREVGQRDA